MMLCSDTFDVCVIGAGVVGIPSAYFLAKLGLRVLVVEVRHGPALEASFANGGQISASDVEPWASASTLISVLKWLQHADSPLLFRPHFNLLELKWLAHWVIECMPHRSRRNSSALLKMVQYSMAKLEEIRNRENLHYDRGAKGGVKFYRNAAKIDRLARHAETCRRNGIDVELVDPVRIVQLEPELIEIGHLIAGGTYTAADEAADCYQFTCSLAEVCRKQGVSFLFNHEVTNFTWNGNGRAIRSVYVRDLSTSGYREILAHYFVLAAGARSALLGETLGLGLNIFPVKGYSATVTPPSVRGPYLTVVDAENHCVFTRLGNRLRVAGTAELDGWSVALNERRCEMLKDLMDKTFPHLKDHRAKFWAGLRPATPSGLPYVGRSSGIDNLFINSGHGTLGWTLAVGSGDQLAESFLRHVKRI